METQKTKQKKKEKKHKRPQIDKEILRKKKGAGRIRLPGLRLYYKDIVIEIVLAQ